MDRGSFESHPRQVSRTEFGEWLERLRVTPPEQREALARSFAEGDPILVEQMLELVREIDTLTSTLACPSGVHRAPVLPQAGETLGSVTLQEVVGVGGQSVVFRGLAEPPLPREVAVKWIRSRPNTPGRRRFKDECEAHARMGARMGDHGIARVYSAGLTPTGHPFIVMELVPGASITEYADRQRLSIAQRCTLFARVCDAIQHAHTRAVVHRDISPRNILVASNDRGEPAPKIIDFGIAMVADPAEPAGASEASGVAIGTLLYMSAEQTHGSIGVDARSDVYGLAAVLYELLAGSPPFEEEKLRALSPASRHEMIRHQDPDSPSERVRTAPDIAALARSRDTTPNRLVATLGRDLDALIAKGLKKDPALRYPTAESLGADLRRYVRDEPLVGIPSSTWSQAWKFSRRNRPLVVGATAAALLLIAATVVAALQARRAKIAEADVRVQIQALLDLTGFMNGGLDLVLRALPAQTAARHAMAAQIVAVVEALTARHPQDRSMQVLLAQTLSRAGSVLGDPGVANLGETEQAIRVLERAEQTANAISEEDLLDRPDGRREHIDVLLLLGEIRLARGRIDDMRGHGGALEWYGLAREAFARAAHESRSPSAAHLKLAYADKLTCSTLAGIHRVQLRMAEEADGEVAISAARAKADHSLERARKLAESVESMATSLSAESDDPASTFLHAEILQTTAEALVAAALLDRAQSVLETAGSIYLDLASQWPERFEFSEGYGSNRRYMARVAESRGDLDLAASLRAEAVHTFEEVLSTAGFRAVSLRAICLVWSDAARSADERGAVDSAVTSGEQYVMAARRLRAADPSDKAGLAHLLAALQHQSARLEASLRDPEVGADGGEAVRLSAIALIDEALGLVAEHEPLDRESTARIAAELVDRRDRLTALE